MDWLMQVGFFVIGLIVGGLINWGIYALAWDPRPISPWGKPHKSAPPRHWSDRIPVFGWLGLRREAEIHGRGFWIRPILIELATGAVFLMLQQWELHGGLVPEWPNLTLPPDSVTWSNIVIHLVLFSLMMVATFIDFDEKTIPDLITIPGTLLALAWSIFFPQGGLPIVDVNARVVPLRFHSPNPWLEWLEGSDGLWIGIAILVGWCIALLPYTWPNRTSMRLGQKVSFLVASILRPRRKYEKKNVRRRRPSPLTVQLVVIAVLGSVLIGAIWSIGGVRWQSFFTSLVGLAGGASVVLAIRIVGSLALKKEAMGMGDVTLMGMIGAVMGWQFAVVTLFLAPFGAVFIGIAQLIITRRTDLAFGPYLCFGAAVLYVTWADFWNLYAQGAFQQGIYVPLLLASGICLMGGMLYIYRLLRDAIFDAFAKEE